MQNWTAVANSTFGTSSYISAIAYGNNKWVAVGADGKMAYSADGITWTAVTDSTFGTSWINAIAYGNNRFVAVSANVSANGIIAYSDDNGVTWTAITGTNSTFNPSYIRAIAYGNNRFVAGSYDGKIAYSDDNGVTWTAITGTNSTFDTSAIQGIAYGNNRFVAVGADGKIAYSSDGVTWTAVADSTIWDYTSYDNTYTAHIYGIAYGNNTWVAVGRPGKMAYSTDNGITWTAVTETTFATNIDIKAIAYGNNRFVAGSYDGKIAYSDDGITWTAVADSTLGYTNIEGIAYGNNRFVAVGSEGKMAYSGDYVDLGTRTVTFNSNGGTTVPVQTVASGGYASEPQNVTKDGYTLAGWFRDDNTFQDQWVFATDTVSADITLYAKWEGGEVPVTFNTLTANGNATATTTTLTLTFSAAITGLTANEISLSGVAGVQAGTLSGAGPTYTLPISGFTAGGELTVTVAKAGYNISGSHTVTIYYFNLNLEMVFVPGGSFDMGKNLGTGGGSDVTPVHTVTLTGFSIGKYEVTQAQWQAVMGRTIQQQQALESATGTNYGRGDNYPVYYVNWYDALVFCNKLSVMEGLTPAYRISGSTDPTAWGTVPTLNTSSNKATWDAVTIDSDSTGYRLPTEAQWEYAAKGGNGTPGNYTYAGSNTVGDVAWYTGNNSGSSGTATYGTKAVGTKAPNGLGLYDMSGNVQEWCWDWYGSYSSGAQTDPTGASSGSYRVLRGGGWNSSDQSARSAYRYDASPYYRNYDRGFRVLRPAP